MQENIRDSNLPHFTLFHNNASDNNCLIKEVEEYNGDAYTYIYTMMNMKEENIMMGNYIVWQKL